MEISAKKKVRVLPMAALAAARRSLACCKSQLGSCSRGKGSPFARCAKCRKKGASLSRCPRRSVNSVSPCSHVPLPGYLRLLPAGRAEREAVPPSRRMAGWGKRPVQVGCRSGWMWAACSRRLNGGSPCGHPPYALRIPRVSCFVRPARGHTPNPYMAGSKIGPTTEIGILG
jgi:hypothetical protein